MARFFAPPRIDFDDHLSERSATLSGDSNRISSMMVYEDIDAWKGCHALVMAVLPVTCDALEKEPDIIHRLRFVALRSAATLAFGVGARNGRMLRQATERSAGYLSEFAYYLTLSRMTGALSENLCASLDALRGRAAYYTWQLWDSLLTEVDGDGTGRGSESK